MLSVSWCGCSSMEASKTKHDCWVFLAVFLVGPLTKPDSLWIDIVWVQHCGCPIYIQKKQKMGNFVCVHLEGGRKLVNR